MYFKDGRWIVYGVANSILIQNGTCINQKPSFFTKVPKYLSWIDNILRPQPNNQLYNGVCGTPTQSPSVNGQNLNRIVNGQSANINSWPWMISIKIFNGQSYKHICSAVLISPKFALTAPNCLAQYNNDSSFALVLGNHYLNDYIEYENFFYIANVTYPPSYQVSPSDNNIALIELSRSAVIGDKIQPICLPPSSDPNVIALKKCILAGW